MNKRFCLLLIAMLPMMVFAYEVKVKVDGIYYILDEDKCEATVTYQRIDPFSGDGKTSNSMAYQGDIIIPSSFTHNGKEYKVVCIGANAFMNSKELSTVELPSSILSIMAGAFAYSSVRQIKIGENVKKVYGAFMNCSRLKEISFPNSVDKLDCSFIHGSISKISIGTGVKSIPAYFLSYCPLSDFYCFSKNPPSTNENSFYWANLFRATLHVPQETIEVYKSTSPWNNFGNIVPLTYEIPGENLTHICKKPKIFYKSGKLSFESETPNAEFVSTITDDDIKSYYGESVDLSLTYTIKVYAFAEGYENSDEATATLCWIDQQPQTEGVNDITQVSARAILIQGEDGSLTIQGAEDGTRINVYDISGKMSGSSVSHNGIAHVKTSLRSGSIAIIKIGAKRRKNVYEIIKKKQTILLK